MPIADLVSPAAPTFPPEVQLAQTAKLIERTFGVPAADLGELAMHDGIPGLTVTHKGAQRLITWERDNKARVVWRIDGMPVLGIGGEGALNKLVAALDEL